MSVSIALFELLFSMFEGNKILCGFGVDCDYILSSDSGSFFSGDMVFMLVKTRSIWEDITNIGFHQVYCTNILSLLTNEKLLYSINKLFK